MTEREFASSYDEQSLMPLVDNSEFLDIVNGEVVVIDKIPTPTKLGIPQPLELIRDTLGTLATKHIWTGYYDVHHLAWPGCEYRAINTGDSYVGSYYRGSGGLKIRMPRQLHKYIHAITTPPPVPEYEIMEQWAKESQQIERLYNTVRLRNLSDIDMPEEQREVYRFSNYLQKLEAMEDGQLGYMPDREYLMQLEIDDARRTLRALARVRGFSNARKQQRQFFDMPLATRAA